MRSDKIEALLAQIRRFAFARLLLQSILIFGSAVAIWFFLQAAAAKYLFYYPTISLIVFGAVLVAVFAHCLGLYLGEKESVVAARLDREFQLKDRLSTYIELRDSTHLFAEALCRETAARTNAIEPRRAIHWRRGITLPALLALITVTAMLVVPYLPVPQSIAQRKAELRQVHAQMKELEKAVAKLQQQNPKNPELQKLLLQVQTEMKELQKPETDKVEALKKLNALQDALQQKYSKLDTAQKEALSQKLSELGKPSTGSKTGSGAEQKQIEELSKALDQALQGTNSSSGEKVQEKLQNGNISKADLEKLKKALEDYKAQKAESDKTMAQLQKSLEESQKGMSGGNHKITYDSRMSERQTEKGKSGVEDGPGTTNKDTGPNHFDTKKKGPSNYAEDKTKAEYEQLYKGQRENAGKDSLFLNSEWNQNGDPKFTQIRTLGEESNPGITGGNGGTSAQSSIESEVRKEKIPASYQQIVKKYFESIQQ